MVIEGEGILIRAWAASLLLLGPALGYGQGSSPKWLVLTDFERRGKLPYVHVTRCDLVGTSILTLKKAETVTADAAGINLQELPSPHGAWWAWISSDPKTNRCQVDVWQAKPLKRVFKAQFEMILTENWLFSKNCLVLVEHSSPSPRTWIVDANSGSMGSPMKGCIGIIDQPERKTMLRLMTSQTREELSASLTYAHTNVFEQLLEDGVLWTEEGLPLHQWRKVQALKAARGWVADSANNAKDVLTAFFPLNVPRRMPGFLNHRVESVPFTYSPNHGDHLGKTCHSLLINNKVARSFWTKNSIDGSPQASLSPRGELLFSGPSYHDLTRKPSTVTDAQATMFAVRLTKGIERRWTINHGGGMLLWQ